MADRFTAVGLTSLTATTVKPVNFTPPFYNHVT